MTGHARPRNKANTTTAVIPSAARNPSCPSEGVTVSNVAA